MRRDTDWLGFAGILALMLFIFCVTQCTIETKNSYYATVQACIDKGGSLEDSDSDTEVITCKFSQ